MKYTLIILTSVVLIGVAGISGCKESGGSSSTPPAAVQAEPAGRKSMNLSDVQKQAEQAVSKAVQEGKKLLSQVRLKDQNGNLVDVGSYIGKKAVVLEWTNDQCPFVKPHLEKRTFTKLYNEYKDDDVLWFSINSNNFSTVEYNKAFSDKYNIPYPILDDAGGEIGKMFGATNTPQIFVFDRTGANVYSGAVDNAPRGQVQGDEYVNYVSNVLDDVIAGKEVTQAKTKPYGCTVKYVD